MTREEKGYLTVEAAFWIPAISLFLVVLIWLCSYLYQGCFMMQAAYVAAFRGSRIEDAGQRETYTEQQLDELMKREVLSFADAQREVKADVMAVTVTLRKDTPLLGPDGEKLVLERAQKAMYLDPVAFIRGIQFLEKANETGSLEKAGDQTQ